jgi:antitoxin component YwqK of YwqJK toxin-antitoxin module
MSRVSLTAFLFLLSVNSFSQNKLETTALNRVTYQKKDTVYLFYVAKAPDKLKVRMRNKYHWFASDTILITSGGFDGKLLHGTFKVFYPNKNLKEEGEFEYGRKTGIWRSWATNGMLVEVVKWKGRKKKKVRIKQ